MPKRKAETQAVAPTLKKTKTAAAAPKPAPRMSARQTLALKRIQAAPKKVVAQKVAPVAKPAPKKPAPKKPAPKKPAPKKVAAKKAVPITKPTPAKDITSRKPKDDTPVESAPKAKGAKDTAAMNKHVEEVAEKKKIAVKLRAEKEGEKRAAAEQKKIEREIARILALPLINEVSTKKFDIYVFGENSAGELGLGAGKDPNGKSVSDVKRPRINHHLFADSVGVAQIAVGGMHCVALTHDNKIYTWGVNDQGALGRVTDAGPMKDMDDASKDDDSDSDSDAGANLNASEATPGLIDTSKIPEGVNFSAVFAGDSNSFALTTTGLVYGWGTFRGNDGILGFRVDEKQANVPTLIPELKEVVDLACGTNHVLALTKKGKVFAWGAGEQNQLARRVMARSLENGLVPREFGLGRKKIVKIGAGDYHSFVIDDRGVKYGWGLNTFGQTGVEKKFDTDDIVMQPTVITNLADYNIKQVTGGAHHSIAVTDDGKVLVFGRVDGHQAGILLKDLPEDKIFSDLKGPRFLEQPLELEIEGTYVAAAGDTCMAVDKEGVAWAWGSSENFQTGTGQDTEVFEATEIDNSAVRGKKLVFCGLGGQFGVLCGEH